MKFSSPDDEEEENAEDVDDDAESVDLSENIAFTSGLSLLNIFKGDNDLNFCSLWQMPFSCSGSSPRIGQAVECRAPL